MTRAKKQPAPDAAPVKDLTAAEIFAAADSKPLPVDVPEWGGRVYVRVFNLDDRAEWHALAGEADEVTRADMAVNLVAVAACDANGVRMFSADDRPLLRGKAGSAIERIALAAARLNRLTDSAAKDAAGN